MLLFEKRFLFRSLLIILPLFNIAWFGGNKEYKIAKQYIERYQIIFSKSKGADRDRRISDLKIKYNEKIRGLSGDIQSDLNLYEMKKEQCQKYYIEQGDSYFKHLCDEYRDIISIYYSSNPRKTKKAIELKQKALSLYKNGDYTNKKQALKYFSEAIDIDPNNVSLYTNRAVVFRLLGEHKKAIKDYNKAIDFIRDQSNALGITLQVMFYTNKNVYENYLLRGFEYFSLKKYKKALKDFTVAINIDQNNPTGYLHSSIAYLKLKKVVDACNHALKACELGDCNIFNSLKNNNVCK